MPPQPCRHQGDVAGGVAVVWWKDGEMVVVWWKVDGMVVVWWKAGGLVEG